MRAPRRYILILSFFAFSICSPAFAQNAGDEVRRASLKGVSTVFVMVSVPDSLVRAGLSEELIMRGVRARLVRAGLRLNEKPAREFPTLYIRVREQHVAYEDLTVYSVSVSARMLQIVALPNGVRSLIPTWDVDMVGLYVPDSLGKVIDVSEEMTRNFVDDWMLSNPKSVLPPLPSQ